MRDYGKVFTQIWSSTTFREMSEDGRTLALYLLTSPHGTIAGVFRLPDGYVCEDLQWDSERVANAFSETLAKGFANRCETTKWVWINRHFEWNPPENPNQRKSAQKIATQIPDTCAWKLDFMRACGEFIGLESKPFDNPSETLSQPVTVTVAVTGTEAVVKETLLVAQPAEPSPPVLTVVGSPAGQQSRDKKAKRLAPEWVLPKSWGEWALANTAMDADVVRLEAAKFRDFWVAKSGKDATKLDWEATWRNWCRNAKAALSGASQGPSLLAGCI